MFSPRFSSVLESKRDVGSDGNVRTGFPPMRMREIAVESGFEVESEEIRESGAGLQDGFWKVSSLSREREKEIGLLRDAGVKDAEVVAIEAMFDALKQGVEFLVMGKRKRGFKLGWRE